MWGKPAAWKRTRVSCHDVNVVLRCLQVHLVPRYLVFIQAHQVAQLFLNLATTEHAHQHEGEVVVAKGGACVHSTLVRSSNACVPWARASSVRRWVSASSAFICARVSVRRMSKGWRGAFLQPVPG